MLLRKHSLEVREITRELAAQQQPAAQLEKQMILIAGETQHGGGVGIPGQLLKLGHRLARQQRSIRTGNTGKISRALHHRQTMSVGGHHRETAFF